VLAAGQTVALTAVHGAQTTASLAVQFVSPSAQTTAGTAVHDGQTVALVGVQVSVSFLKSPNLLLPPPSVVVFDVVLLDYVVLLDNVVLLDYVALEPAFNSNNGKSTPVMINLLVESS
jgi:hypothetical protein